MTNSDEERVMARGLKPPGPLLMVKKRLAEHGVFRMRVIVSDQAAARELVAFFQSRGGVAEIDRAGTDFHVVADLRGFKNDFSGAEGDSDV